LVDPLQHDAFKPELGDVREQCGAIEERFYLAHEWHVRLAAKPVQIMLALAQGRTAQINAVLMQQVEHHKDQLRSIRPARAHLVMELAEVRLALASKKTSSPSSTAARAGGLHHPGNLAPYSAPDLEKSRTSRWFLTI